MMTFQLEQETEYEALSQSQQVRTNILANAHSSLTYARRTTDSFTMSRAVIEVDFSETEIDSLHWGKRFQQPSIRTQTEQRNAERVEEALRAVRGGETTLRNGFEA